MSAEWKGLAAAVCDILAREPLPEHPDARLFAMAVEHAALTSIRWPAGSPDSVVMPVGQRIIALERRMARFRASTPEGMLVRMRVAWLDIAAPDGGCHPVTGEMYSEVAMSAATMRDLKRMAG